MASGHVNCTYRPNTWPHRPSLRREDFYCQPGAFHTCTNAEYRPILKMSAIHEDQK
jgi:hypothetical protein